MWICLCCWNENCEMVVYILLFIGMVYAMLWFYEVTQFRSRILGRVMLLVSRYWTSLPTGSALTWGRGGKKTIKPNWIEPKTIEPLLTVLKPNELKHFIHFSSKCKQFILNLANNLVWFGSVFISIWTMSTSSYYKTWKSLHYWTGK